MLIKESEIRQYVRQLIKEAFGRPDVTNDEVINNWIKIGECSDKIGLYANPNVPIEDVEWVSQWRDSYEIDDWKERSKWNNIKEKLFVYVGEQNFPTYDVMPYNKRNLQIYPKYVNTPYGWCFFGKPTEESDKEKEQIHQHFLDRLDMYNGKVLLHHNSSKRITNGVLEYGHGMNTYSNNSDVSGVYFWANKGGGKDPSNGGQYTYYSIIPLDKLYDMNANFEHLKLQVAMRKYGYAAVDFGGGIAAVGGTTPIAFIRDNSNGKWYNSKWEEIEQPI